MVIPGDEINKYKNCIICGGPIEFDHHYGKCWKCVCKGRLEYYKESLRIYEKRLSNCKDKERNLYEDMVGRTKKEIEQWTNAIEKINAEIN